MTPKKILLLFIVLAFGAFLRFTNLNWDQGYTYHPDERNIASAVVRLDPPEKLDPGFHAYNGFSIYLIRFVAEAVASVTNDSTYLTDWGKINLISRSLSATASFLSLILVFTLGNLISLEFALLATTLSAFSVGFLQYAHYGVTESLLVFLLLLILFFTTRIKNKSSLLHWGHLGLISGIAIGTKTSAVSFLTLPLVVWLTTLSRKNFFKYLTFGVYFLSLLILTFFVVSPYSLLDLTKFKESMDYEGGVVSGRLSVPYNLQFTGTLPYLFFLKNLPWHLSPFPALFGIIGLPLWLFGLLRKDRRHPFLPLLFFGLLYFLYIGSWHTKFLRYLIPLEIALIFSATWILQVIKQKSRILSRILIISTIATSILWSLMHYPVFSTLHTRIEASNWIYQNLPQDSVIAHEHWDDRLPTQMPKYPNDLRYEEILSYEEDTQGKFDQLQKQLNHANYYIISSRRVYGSILRNEKRYPRMSLFYKQLFAGETDFKLLKTFSSYPRLGPLIIKDDSAEETFQVYDHPVIYIFGKK